MDRKEGAAGLLSPSSVVARVLAMPLVAGLLLCLAILPGCNSQGNAARQNFQQMRPVGNTARLVQNASYFRKCGRTELAVDELEQARLKEPDNLEILDLLIQCYEDLRDFDRAQELYEEALSRRDGHHPAIENNRCYSLYLQGRLDQAEVCFRKALARQPDNQKIRNNLGLVLCRQGRETEALAMWREALNDGEARQRMGQALAALGREVPPSLAGPAPAPVVAQVVPGGSPSGAVAKAAPSPAPSSPAPQAVAQTPVAPPGASASQMTGGAEEHGASKTPAGYAPSAAPAASLPQVASTPDQPSPQKANTTPGPNQAPVTAVRAAAPAPAGEPPSPAPAAASTVKQPKKAATPVLTAQDLGETRIELKNGNGVQDFARETRNYLFFEGFNVVSIGNHIDFGLEETVIAYRPEAARMAQTLSQKFFPGAKLQEEGKFSPGADIRISLGHDRLTDTNIARMQQVIQAARALAAAPVGDSLAAAPFGKSAKSESPRQLTSSGATPPDFLTTQELNQVRIELKNGNGIAGQAWEMGGHLALEGFTVVNVSNHKDFGLEKTVIAYRPEAARVAQVLSKKFFPKATLEEQSKLPPWTDVRVSLGRDLIPGQEQVAQASVGSALH